MKKDSLNYDQANIERVRRLRGNMSVSERRLWESIRRDALGFRFKRQVPVGRYVLDFYCSEASLCIEVDGEQHAGRASEDKFRDAFIEGRGIMTIRVPSLDLFDELGGVHGRWLDLIATTCEERSGRSRFERNARSPKPE
ncbi:MAG: DUF559 domain-containing protein [Fimbriimonadaceae bacterium]|nr:DUF559 domain-containing protein [Fimbriimonadaceae bacterium]QYK55872.1 MAG: DUF559 domain-containing protein [Fimbriimonadaceae bacterium]